MNYGLGGMSIGGRVSVQNIIVIGVLAVIIIYFIFTFNPIIISEEPPEVIPILNHTLNTTNAGDVTASQLATPDLSICDIAFAITTSPKYYSTRLSHALKSWIKRLCSKFTNYLFITSKDTENQFPYLSVDCVDSWGTLCCKTQKLLRELHQHFPHAKWYMKSDDDTLIIPENLVMELSKLDYRKPYLIGEALFFVPGGIQGVNKTFGRTRPWGLVETEKKRWPNISANVLYPRGGAGYVISKGFMDVLVEGQFSAFDLSCSRRAGGTMFEDLAMGLTSLRINATTLSHDGFRGYAPQEFYEYEYSGVVPITWHLNHDNFPMAFFDYLIHSVLDHQQLTPARLPKTTQHGFRDHAQTIQHFKDMFIADRLPPLRSPKATPFPQPGMTRKPGIESLDKPRTRRGPAGDLDLDAHIPYLGEREDDWVDEDALPPIVNASLKN